MLALLLAVLTASLLGSMHCAGMCGAFVVFAVGAADPRAGQRPAPSRTALNAAYNLGRLGTYLVLGLVAGAVGSAIDLGGSMVGVQRGAAIAAGAIMIGFGIVALLRSTGVRVPRMPVPGAMVRLAQAGHGRALEMSPLARAGAVGLLTTLLPCGWLYAFVVTSAGTGDALLGAATMAVFWLGTLPVMAGLGYGMQSLAGPLRRHLPLVTSLLVVGAGVWTLTGRMLAPLPTARAATPAGDLRAAASAIKAQEPSKACPLCTDE